MKLCECDGDEERHSPECAISFHEKFDKILQALQEVLKELRLISR